MLRSFLLATSVVALSVSSSLACSMSKSNETAQTPVPAQTAQASSPTLTPTEPAKTEVAEAPKSQTTKAN